VGWNLLSSIPESLAQCGQVTLPIEEAASSPLYLDTSGVSLLESGPLLHNDCHFKSFFLFDSLGEASSVRVEQSRIFQRVYFINHFVTLSAEWFKTTRRYQSALKMSAQIL
jgi:hypothetical protein